MIYLNKIYLKVLNFGRSYNEELVSSSVSPDVYGVADKFTAIVKMVARTIVFKNEDLDLYVNKKISSKDIDGKRFF